MFCLALLIYLCPEVSIAQTEFPYRSAQDAELPEWVKLMYSHSPDPGKVVDAYNTYYTTESFVKNSHTQYYKRWLRSIARELPPLRSPRNHISQNRSAGAQWQSIGPSDWDHDAIDRSYAPGAAHVYTVEQSLSNPDILYAGTATAGVWKSADRGLSWKPVTDHLRTGSVTAIEINHLRPQTVFAELLNSIYKTVNGGTLWVPTGNNMFQMLDMDVHDIVMHPSDTSIVFAATNLALYRTTNNGISWTSVLSGDFQEIEFHPTRPDTIYTVKQVGDKTEFYLSINNGSTFQLQTSGWPNPYTALGQHQQRTEIAVSPAAPDHVYALTTGMANGGSGLFGVYVSANAGATWVFQCCGTGPGGPPSPTNLNLMGWSDEGLDDGGQYYYDLAFAVSPTNADSIFVGGVNLWVSNDGGVSFVCPAKWSHPHKPNYVHADIHDIHFYPGTHEIWLASDGGIFCSSDDGASFVRKISGINGTDFWGFGAGYWDGEVMLGGAYHNGTLLKDNDVYLNGWISVDGGDNFRGFVNPGKPKQVYSDYNIKSLSGNRIINCQSRSFLNKPNAGYIIGESSDMLFHPQYFGTWYSGSGTKLWKTEDDGFSFIMIHNFGENIAAMDIAMSNPDVIYVCTWPGWWSTKRIYRSDDGGDNWTEITPSSVQLSGNTWIPYDIAVDATNPMKVWILRTSMYGDTELDGFAVYTSNNGGSTWQNITTSALNNEAFTCIMHQAGTHEGVYIGTRESVYYRSADMPNWTWYGDGLPAATFSTKLAPYYREGKLRNGTNRSVWESPFYESSAPIAQPSIISRRHDCMQDTVYFMDHSIISENGASWFWEFPGATPPTSTLRNPKVIYHKSGIYNVSLTVSDVNGSDTHNAAEMIEVQNWCSLDTIPGKALACVASPDYVIVPDIGVTSNTFTISAWVRPTGIQTDYTGIVMSDGVACGFNFREGNNTLGYHWGGSSQAWSWDSNLKVPPNVWAHVAMVVSPSSVKLYVNGKQATHNISHAPASITTMKIGSYQAWQARNFKGIVDEVCIWNRSLSLDEIRALRHLTKVPDEDPGLLIYYQFNEESSIVYDKAHTFDGIINGNATRVKSRAPVGSGVSQSMSITAPGLYKFVEAGLAIAFPTASSTPQGIVYVSRLNTSPDSIKINSVLMSHGYWIMNNYGANPEIGIPDSLSLSGLAFISVAMFDTLSNSLFVRGENDEVAGWKSASEASGVMVSGVSGGTTFSEIGSGFNQLGQIVATRDSMHFGRPQVAIVQEPDTALYQRGGSSMALSIQGGSKGLLLPRYSSIELQNVPSPKEGSIVFVSDLMQIACFNGFSWQLLHAEYLEPPVYSGLPEIAGVSLAGGSTASALLSLGAKSGVLIVPAFTAPNIVDIDFPKEGLLIYRSDLDQLAYYDGIDWIHPPSTVSEINANVDVASQNVQGIRIGIGAKDPNALLHIIDKERALGIPVARTSDIKGPHAGLIIFDPSLRMLCLFDGVGWQVVK